MIKPSSTLLQQVSLWVLVGFAALSVLFLLPITDNFILITKNFVLFFSAIAVLALFLVRSAQRKALEFVLAPFNWLLIFFGLAVLASTFFTNAYPVEGLLGMGGAYLSFVLIALFGGTLLSRANADRLLTSLGVIGAILTLGSFLELAGTGPSQLMNALFGLRLPSSLVFNLTGSALIGAQFLAVVILGLVSTIIREKVIAKPTAILLPILVLGLGLHLYAILPGKPAELQLPSFAASWSVALDTIRQPRSALIGAGLGSYGNVYSQFKPVWVNGQNWWNIQFIQGANVPLTLLTTMGFVGLLAWVLLALALLREVRNATPEGKPLIWMIAATLALQLLFPANIVMLTIQAILVAAYMATQKSRFSVAQVQALSVKVAAHNTKDPYGAPELSRPTKPLYFGLGVAALGLLFLAYLTGRAYAAHYYLNEAAKAAAQDDAIALYERQKRAVQLNPYLDQFRREYAFTNMLIAAALSNKTDASEAEKQQVTQLIQQAINEARSATILDPGDSQNWAVLAQVYQNVTGVTEEARQWAVQSYVQAIQTNPTDPGLRVSLGGVFMSAEDYQQAAQFFQTAAQLKPDFANAYYNLAVALRQLGQLEAARDAYRRVLALIDANSEEGIQVTKELEALEKEIAAKPRPTASPSASPSPSLIQQNLEEDQNSLVEPDTRELNLDEGAGADETGTGSPQNEPSATGASPASSPR